MEQRSLHHGGKNWPMFVQSFVQSVKRNVSRALTTSHMDVKDNYPSIGIDEFAQFWNPHIQKATTAHSLCDVTTKLLECVSSPLGSHSPRGEMYEEPIFVVKEVGLQALLVRIYKSSLSDSSYEAKINAILSLPFSNEKAKIGHSVLLKFEHLFIASGMAELYAQHLYSRRHLMEDAPALVSAAAELLASLSEYGDLSRAVVGSFQFEIDEEMDRVKLLQILIRNWMLSTLRMTVHNLWIRFELRLQRLRNGSGPASPRGRNLVSAEEAGSVYREPSSSAESVGELEPYERLQLTASEQQKEIEISERLINLGTLALRLEQVYAAAAVAEAKNLKNNISEFQAKLRLGSDLLEKGIQDIEAKQTDQETRFEETKSSVSHKLTKELEELQIIKENTSKERSAIEKEIQDFSELIKKKQADLEVLKEKEHRISELFCQIAQEMDSLNLSFTAISQDSLRIIENKKSALQHLKQIESEVQKLRIDEPSTEVHDIHKHTRGDVIHIIENYMLQVVPKFYQTEREIIQLGCDRLKQPSLNLRQGGSPYRPMLAQTAVSIDRQAKHVEGALRELSLKADKKAEYDDAVTQAYRDCRTLINSNHHLIFT
eukprot:Gregarina_sp_Poly_1__1911@NODE_149_length_12634_cov_195_682741_g133_i0_p2_GENE_NODE_149_length_12634_cov_195_682741_g133_i0NODE_149_length_12634_cov_195_682741_g133_i0_p2_ORF_typecomplete_len602_score79_46MAD/PF05557_13/0_011AAA_15/PF13175_6/0_046DUF3418/PF11898_8/0_07Rab_eff_C/PF04698_12/0_67Rab_eff_C/PF04698_12/1_9e03SCP1/PF05483_12/3_3e03SCP1/PF05483_12/37SCP1/PF05483_12/1_9Noelin1/PF12308_8/2_2e03Noelin1/PF12308_8/0_79Noelin1/PF12308_8/1_2e02Tht1/PF04163_12/14AAA_13/PF13166_6/0_46AAA_13/PF13